MKAVLKLNMLEWDSKFWETEIYSYTSECGSLDTDGLQANKWMIQALVAEADLELINTLEESGFRFVESKVTLVKVLERRISINSNNFRKVSHEEIEKRRNVFFDMYGRNSRYSIFSKEKINLFYCTWVNNSIDGTMDDDCIGYYTDNELAGFLTYRIRHKEMQIGIVGVFEEYQEKGIGTNLLSYLNNIALDNSCEKIIVATQGKNRPAINVYIKNGFAVHDIKNWFYLKGGNGW